VAGDVPAGAAGCQGGGGQPQPLVGQSGWLKSMLGALGMRVTGEAGSRLRWGGGCEGTEHAANLWLWQARARWEKAALRGRGVSGGHKPTEHSGERRTEPLVGVEVSHQPGEWGQGHLTRSLVPTAQVAFNCDRCLIEAGIAGQVAVKSTYVHWRGGVS